FAMDVDIEYQEITILVGRNLDLELVAWEEYFAVERAIRRHSMRRNAQRHIEILISVRQFHQRVYLRLQADARHQLIEPVRGIRGYPGSGFVEQRVCLTA